MRFDKTAYKESKHHIVDLIKASHAWENTEGFIADGVIAPDVYESQPVRILCVLAESYGYDKAGMVDIEGQPRYDVMGLRNPSVQTPRRLASVLHLLQRALEKGEMVTLEEWLAGPKLLAPREENIAILQEALSKVAWINVKKASNGNGTELDAIEAQTHAKRNESILREQIKSIAPDVIIVCGEVAFRSLHGMGLLGPETALARKWQMQGAKVGDDPRVIEVTHPASLRWASYEEIYENAETIFSEMMKA